MPRKSNVLFRIVVGGGIAVAILIGLIAFQSRSAPAKVSKTNIDAQIADLETRLRTDKPDVKYYFALANAYNQKVRETADIAYYKKIEDLLNQAERLDPKNIGIPTIRSVVAAGRHQFAPALGFARQAIALNPDKASSYGLAADALIELGNYPEAKEVLQTMVDLRPDFSAFSRIAYLRELYGDTEGAEQVLREAISAGSVFPENTAWAYVELGKLVMRRNLEQAKKDFEKAQSIFPGYSAAGEGLGKIAFFEGDSDKALDYFQKAFDKLPIAQYATDLGDVYQAKGDAAKAAQQYFISKIAFEKSSASGVNIYLERGLFLADHNLDLSQALDDAKQGYKTRPNIYAADALAWAYYKNRDYEHASEYIKKAFQLGEHDPLILFHAGMIAQAQGRKEAKNYLEKALAIHPYFSMLQVPKLKETLRGL